MWTLTDVKTETRDRLKDTAVSPILNDTRFLRWAKEFYLDFIPRTGGGWLYDEYTFSSVASTAEYAFPSRFMRALKLFDTTNNKEVFCGDNQDEVADPDRSNTGTPSWYQRAYLLEVQAQPSSASVITASSSSASDVTSYFVQIRGLDANSNEIEETITLNGATGVATTASFTKVYEVTKNGTSNGIVTVTSNTAAVTLVKLSKEETRRQFQWIRLVSVPDSVIAYRLHFLRKPRQVVDAYDSFEIPDYYSGAMLNFFEWKGAQIMYEVSKQQSIFGKYIESINQAIDFVGRDLNYVTIHKEIEENIDSQFGYISRRAP